MFAFLPKTNPKMCGISDSSTEDVEGSMSLKANDAYGEWISLTGDKSLRFKEGRPNVRAYDSCFYEVGSTIPQLTKEDKEKMKLS